MSHLPLDYGASDYGLYTPTITNTTRRPPYPAIITAGQHQQFQVSLSNMSQYPFGQRQNGAPPQEQQQQQQEQQQQPRRDLFELPSSPDPPSGPSSYSSQQPSLYEQPSPYAHLAQQSHYSPAQQSYYSPAQQSYYSPAQQPPLNFPQPQPASSGPLGHLYSYPPLGLLNSIPLDQPKPAFMSVSDQQRLADAPSTYLHTGPTLPLKPPKKSPPEQRSLKQPSPRQPSPGLPAFLSLSEQQRLFNTVLKDHHTPETIAGRLPGVRPNPFGNTRTNLAQLIQCASHDPTVPASQGRAVMIGINYWNQKGELRVPCCDSARNLGNYLQQSKGFREEDILLLADDYRGANCEPTKRNIIIALAWLVKNVQQGERLILYYSGHGTVSLKAEEKKRASNGRKGIIDQMNSGLGSDTGAVPDIDADADEDLEAIFPVDFRAFKEGMITGKQLNEFLAPAKAKGAQLTIILDTHAGK